jgi:asparagine synthase (glutamine-hydrolysing)
MCGIAGISTLDGALPDRGVLTRMRDALSHRGPDNDGRYEAGGIGFVHTRLSIIDLETGDQPLFGTGGTVLVANAEIYNFLELRANFREEDFTSRSDCELPLHLYRQTGVDYPRHLRGMYAIALYDPGKRRLLLSRDPFGIKPLYYAETRDGLVFASEPSAILASGLIKPEQHEGAIGELLQLQFTTGRMTVYRNIFRVLPGETLVIENGRIVERHRHNQISPGKKNSPSIEDACAQLDHVLMEAVDLHQRADVPYGLFLSGGIDSSVILACMARLNDQPVRAFTAGFSDTEVQDERAHARQVAKAVGAEHIEIEIGEKDFWRLLPAAAAAMDDPAADYAILPTYMLAEKAARELKVVLSGEGGDELFAGYGRYRSAVKPTWLGGRAMRARGFLDGLNLLREEMPGWRDGISAAERRWHDSGVSRLQLAQLVDCADWLPNDLLIKLDRCLMAHGLEGRTPFLDIEVARFAINLDDRLKLYRGQGKYLLRHWLERHLPQARPLARKRGFTVPVGKWMSRRSDMLGPLIAASPGVQAFFRPQSVEALFRRLSSGANKRVRQAAWTLLFYALWHRCHIEKIAVEEDVFAMLASKG